MTREQFRTWTLQKVPHNIPERSGLLLALRERKRTGSVGGASREAVTHRRLACGHILAFLILAHHLLRYIDVLVNVRDGTLYGDGCRFEQAHRFFKLTLANYFRALELVLAGTARYAQFVLLIAQY